LLVKGKSLTKKFVIFEAEKTAAKGDLHKPAAIYEAEERHRRGFGDQKTFNLVAKSMSLECQARP
jgi:hypothetical protein